MRTFRVLSATLSRKFWRDSREISKYLQKSREIQTLLKSSKDNTWTVLAAPKMLRVSIRQGKHATRSGGQVQCRRHIAECKLRSGWASTRFRVGNTWTVQKSLTVAATRSFRVLSATSSREIWCGSIKISRDPETSRKFEGEYLDGPEVGDSRSHAQFPHLTIHVI